MAVPPWVERLRTASFVSPSGIDTTFHFDVSNVIGGKKASQHEILNKNEAIPQDQGNRSLVFPVEAYFSGENPDIEAKRFFDSLGEKYTIDSPGIFKHPETIWGDIPVMPFEFQQSHNLVTEGGIVRVAVEFHTIPQSRFPTAEGLNESEIVSDMDDLDAVTAVANEGINVDDPGRFAEFGAKVTDVVRIVDDAIGDIASRVDDVEDKFRQVQAGIDSAIQAGASAVEIMSQVNVLIRLPAQIIDTTITKVTGYGNMAQDIALSFLNTFNPEADEQTQINNGIMLQSLTSLSASATAEASLFTDFETRDTAGDALGLINTSSDVAIESTAQAYQILLGSFAPDHNTGLTLELITGKTNSILVDRSFDLKAKQIIILSGPSDPYTETWKYYKDLDQLDFYLRTNMITDNEHIEMSAGRETVVYV